MKLNYVEISGMHNIKDRKLVNLDNKIYLWGRNGSGKSTILQAIQLGLLGYVPGTNKTKSEIFSKHAGGNILDISVSIDLGSDNLVINRTWMKKGNSIIHTTNYIPDQYDEEFVKNLIRDTELPIFNFSDFLNLTANKMKDWFFDFLPKDISDIDFKGRFQAKLDSEGIVLKDVQFLDNLPLEDLQGSTMDKIRELNDRLKSRLSNSKVELKRVEDTIQSLIYYSDVDDCTDSNSLKIRLEDLNTRLHDIKSAKESYERNYAMREELKSYSDYSSSSAEEDPTFLENQNIYDDCIQTIKECEDKIARLNDDISRVDSDIQYSKHELNSIEYILNSNGHCPLLECRCDDIADRLDDYQSQFDKRKAEIESMEGRKSTIQSDIGELNDKITSCRNNQKVASSNCETIKLRYHRKEVLMSSLHEVSPYLDYDAEIDSLEKSIEHTQDELVKIEANNRYNELVDKLTETRFNLEQQMAAYKVLISFTGVNGLQNEYAVAPFKKLSEYIDEFIPNLFGDDCYCKFNLESSANSFGFGLVRGLDYIPFESLSSGERCMFTLALMIAITRMSKQDIKLVMVDDLFDHLDDNNVKLLFQSLDNVLDVQMILAGVESIGESNFASLDVSVL